MTQCLRGVEQRRDRHLVTDLGARGELHGDFDRQGAGFEQDNGGLAVERAAGGDGHAGAHGLAGDVVPEREVLVALDEQVRLEELPDRCEQVRGRPPERARQLVERERAAERGGDGHGVACLVGEPAEPLAHLLVHAAGKPAVDQLGAAVDDADPLLFSQSEERLDDEERAAVGFRQLLQDRLIGLRGEHVRGQPRDRIVSRAGRGRSCALPPASAVRARARAASLRAAGEARSPRRSAIPSAASAACEAPRPFRCPPTARRRSRSGAATRAPRARAAAAGLAAARTVARAAHEALVSSPGSSSGSAPSNSAASSAASSTTVSLGSAALRPTLMPRLRAIAATSASRRLLPMPAAPSTTTTASAPSERRSSSARISASSASRPWNSRAGLVDIRSSRRAYPGRAAFKSQDRAMRSGAPA